MSTIYKQVAGRNHIEFMQNFVSTIREGYYLSSDLGQLPVDGAFLTVFLFKGETPPVKGIKFDTIKNFYLHEFLPIVQQAVLEGYDIDYSSLSWQPYKSTKVIKIKTKEGAKGKTAKDKSQVQTESVTPEEKQQ